MSIGEWMRTIILGVICVAVALLVARVATTRYKFWRSQSRFKAAIKELEQEAGVDIISI